jgi:hypothetical protein
MSSWPEAAVLRAFLARAARRLAWLAALRGAAIGLAGTLPIVLALVAMTWRSGAVVSPVLPYAIALGGLVVGCASAFRRRHVAQLVETRAPCRNVVVTAAELLEQPARVRPYIGKLVFAEAARVVGRLDPAALFPARRALAALAGTAALWLIALLLLSTRPVTVLKSMPATIRAAAITGVEVAIVPPTYSGRAAQTLREPARLEVLAGSRIKLAVHAEAAVVTMQTVSGRAALAASTSETFRAEFVADDDGYIAIEPVATNGQPGVRRLVGLSVVQDQPPRVRVTVPGRDLFLRDASRAIDVTVEADDDLALRSLRLRYTKVSGSGEQFTFTDGEVPLTIARSDVKTWKARATLPLPALTLSAGDMIVYRAVANDRRPGAPAVESDAYIVELAAPGAMAAEGFTLDDEHDRYALSQQMVILKTERLLARASALPPDSVSQNALAIGAEQRSVRAEFVFMMGGELAEEILAEASMDDLNEEAHAEADDEAIAGRLANQGRLALLRAIRSMSRASAALNAANLERALIEEKAALANLQRAFARTRYILRALTQRERLDLSRRLSGELSAAARSTRAAAEPERDMQAQALRQALAGVSALAGTAPFPADAAARAANLAVSVLQVDPSATPLQQAATQLNDAATAMAGGRAQEARTLLDRAALVLSTYVRSAFGRAPRHARSLELQRLEGALTDALRGRKVP